MARVRMRPDACMSSSVMAMAPAEGLSENQIAERLAVPLDLWLECRRACGQRPLSLEQSDLS